MNDVAGSAAGGPSAAERAQALGTLITELAGAAGATGDRAAGLRFVGELNRALTGLPELLAAGRALLDRTDLGPALTSRLTETWEELEAGRAELAEREEILERLRPALAELDDVQRRHTELTARIADVRRLDALKGEIETLNAARRDLDRRRAELAAVRDAEEDLADAAGELGTRAALRLAELDADTRRAIERADGLAAEISAADHRLAARRSAVATLEADLDALTAEFAELETVAEQVVPRIDAHRRADRELCTALGIGLLVKGSGLDHVQALLADMEERLDRADEAIRAALRSRDAEHATAREPKSLI